MTQQLVCPEPRNWRGLLATGVTFFGGAVAPPAKREYIASLWSWVLSAITQPYAVTLLACDTGDSVAADSYWRFGWTVAPVTLAMRAHVTQAVTVGAATGSPPADVALYTNEATAAADRIDVPTEIPDAMQGLVYQMTHASAISSTSETWDDTPAAGQDRLLEMPYAGYPGWERCYGRYWCAIGGTPMQGWPNGTNNAWVEWPP